MKTIGILLAASIVFLAAGCGEINRTTVSYDEPGNSFQELDNYGYWTNNPTLGSVWHPQVSPDWQPYSAGEWEWTDQGWIWNSDEPFGWIVYHYGYWAFDNNDGWVWIPDNKWEPSRVDWLVRDDYVGWAPMPPPGWNMPAPYENNGNRIWIVVRSQDFSNRDIYKYRTPINSRVPVSNYSHGSVRGPDVDWIQQRTNHPYSPVKIETETIKGRGGNLTRIRKSDGSRGASDGLGNAGIPVSPRNSAPLTTPTVDRPMPVSPNPQRVPPPSQTQPAAPNRPDTHQTDKGNGLGTKGIDTQTPARSRQPVNSTPDQKNPNKPILRNPGNRSNINQPGAPAQTSPSRQKPVRTDRPSQKSNPQSNQPVKKSPPPTKETQRDKEQEKNK
jgi:hypothetical protein